jgi:hypothetical protein
LQGVCRTLQSGELLMNLLHETMEMGSPLGGQRQAFIEQVHQVSLAPAYATPEIEALRAIIPLSLSRQLLTQSAPETLLLAFCLDQFPVQAVKQLNDPQLLIVLTNFAPIEVLPVALKWFHLPDCLIKAAAF